MSLPQTCVYEVSEWPHLFCTLECEVKSYNIKRSYIQYTMATKLKDIVFIVENKVLIA